MEKVLVTGGAGFIGSHIAEAAAAAGYSVTALDNLYPTVHGPEAMRPAYLPPDVEFIQADIRDYAAIKAALQGVTAVFHQAALVGVGQSMYEIGEYTSINLGGTANLLDVIVKEKLPVRTIMLASSISIYGEGAAACAEHGVFHPPVRSRAALEAQQWDIPCPQCGRPASPWPTREDQFPNPQSVYAISKRAQEDLLLCFGRAYGVAVNILRYSGVYGPRQSLKNPYTGINALFSSRLLNGKQPLIFEDGQQSRDFINVRDVARANVLALQSGRRSQEIYNIGSDQIYSVRQVAEMLADVLQVDLPPLITGRFREGDIRHLNTDVTKAAEHLGFRAEITLRDGLRELLTYLKQQGGLSEYAANVDRMITELEEHRLIR